MGHGAFVELEEATMKEMKTLRLVVDPANLESSEAEKALDRAAQILCAGGLVALPTETVYGWGQCSGRGGCRADFQAKERPSWDPVIGACGPGLMAERHARGVGADVPEAARKLMKGLLAGR